MLIEPAEKVPVPLNVVIRTLCNAPAEIVVEPDENQVATTFEDEHIP